MKKRTKILLVLGLVIASPVLADENTRLSDYGTGSTYCEGNGKTDLATSDISAPSTSSSNSSLSGS